MKRVDYKRCFRYFNGMLGRNAAGYADVVCAINWVST
jgi:hypothetical protein